MTVSHRRISKGEYFGEGGHPNACSAVEIQSSFLYSETDLWQTSVRLLNKSEVHAN